jgi:hypothetical protein
MATPNQDPQNVYNRVINFTTTNLLNGNLYEEPHTVILLNGVTPINSLTIQGNPYGPCIVVPLTTNINQGANYLKFHLPQNNESAMYVTFAQKNNNMSDGYYDYIQGIPDSYRNDLRNWIRDGRVLSTGSQAPLERTISFSVRGIDTNVVSASVDFDITFSAVFGLTTTTVPQSR